MDAFRLKILYLTLTKFLHFKFPIDFYSNLEEDYNFFIITYKKINTLGT